MFSSLSSGIRLSNDTGILLLPVNGVVTVRPIEGRDEGGPVPGRAAGALVGLQGDDIKGPVSVWRGEAVRGGGVGPAGALIGLLPAGR